MTVKYATVIIKQVSEAYIVLYVCFMASHTDVQFSDAKRQVMFRRLHAYLYTEDIVLLETFFVALHKST